MAEETELAWKLIEEPRRILINKNISINPQISTSEIAVLCIRNSIHVKFYIQNSKKCRQDLLCFIALNKLARHHYDSSDRWCKATVIALIQNPDFNAFPFHEYISIVHGHRL